MNTHLIKWLVGALCLATVACSSPFADAEIPDALTPNCNPVADFESTSQCAETCVVNFTNRSEQAESFNWNFGDGNSSTEENPSHTYDKPGEYEVSLLVKCGIAEDSISAVLELEPTGWFCGQPYEDDRDGKFYATVWIDVDGGHDLSKEGNCWFAENLRFKAPGIINNCYNLIFDNCAVYGSLYSAFRTTEAIPKGWRLPTRADWEQLLDSYNTTKFIFPNGVRYTGELDAFLPGGRSDFNLTYSGALIEVPDPADPNFTIPEYQGLDTYSIFWVQGEGDNLLKLKWDNFEAFIFTTDLAIPNYSIRLVKE